MKDNLKRWVTNSYLAGFVGALVARIIESEAWERNEAYNGLKGPGLRCRPTAANAKSKR